MLDVSYGGFAITKIPSLWDGVTLTDIGSVTIAILALFVTFRQMKRQRVHDMLSVKPHIDIFEERNHLGENVSFLLELQNNGLGPAILISHKVYKREDQNSEYVEVEDIEAELKKEFANGWFYTSEWHKDVGLSANTKHKYLEIYIKSDDPNEREKIRKTMYSKYKIEIEYKSMYGESFFFSTVPYTEGRFS